MKNNKMLFLFLIVMSYHHLIGQDIRHTYQSSEAKTDIEYLLNQFKPLIEKLPTYETYSPGVFTLDKNNKLQMQMVFEDSSPTNIEECRTKYALMFQKDKSLEDKKLILVCFLDSVLNPLSHKPTEAIAVYAEHLAESACYIYYYPYSKSLSGEIEFDPKSNFRKTTDKIMMK